VVLVVKKFYVKHPIELIFNGTTRDMNSVLQAKS